jgi:hypothetical protein
MQPSFVCNFDMLSEASNDQNELQLIPFDTCKFQNELAIDTFDTWSIHRGTYLECLTYFVGNDVPMRRSMDQTHVYEHIFVLLSLEFCDIFSK